MKIFFFQPSDIYYVHSCFWARWLESDFSISCWLGVLWNIRGWMGTVHVFLEMLLGPCRCSEWVAFTPNCHCLYAVVVLLFPSTVTSFPNHTPPDQNPARVWSRLGTIKLRPQWPQPSPHLVICHTSFTIWNLAKNPKRTENKHPKRCCRVHAQELTSLPLRRGSRFAFRDHWLSFATQF